LFKVIDLAREGNKYLQEKEPWKKTDQQLAVDNCLHMTMQLCANLAILMNPFLPHTATKLCKMMKVVDRMLDWENAGSLKLLSKGYPMNAPELLFRKIEDAEVQAQVEKLHAGSVDTNSTAGAAANDTPILPPVKPLIQFDQFDALDLRTATIIAAKKVPKADKLLELQLDLGFEQRTVVSGIAAHYSPEEIIGLQVTVVANLAPRKMKGIESNGMILMTENEAGKLIFVNPNDSALNGASVK
jgi:methionyl-tRNA synthetase